MTAISIRPALAIRTIKRPEMAALLVLAAVLNLWALDQNGWANEDYSAAVRAMASSWHNLLYGPVDPARGGARGQTPPAPRGAGPAGEGVRVRAPAGPG